MCTAWSIFGGIPPTESLPHWTHLLGLAMLLVIAVCDNGIGIRPKSDSKSSHKSRGTAIVKERLALLRHRGRLEILDCPVGHPFAYGVTAWMTLPLWSLEPTWHANEKRIAS